jgi:AcrR family transcriptional regulator
MSIEAVAEASGVGKTTIYRWWPSKGTLALDAYLEDMRAKVVVPDTGDGGEDLRRHARAVIEFYAGKEGRIFAQFMAEAQSDPGLAEAFRERFLSQRRAAVRTIWKRGVARGDFRDDVDTDVAMDMIFAPIVYRLLAGHAPLSRSLAESLVNAALGGLAAGAAREAHRR